MALPEFIITIDGKGYGGESSETEDSPPSFGRGWTSHVPRTRNLIVLGDPIVIVGRRNLCSAVNRILDHCTEAEEIFIKRI